MNSNPQFVHQYDEVWSTLSKATPETAIEAAALMRQLFFAVISKLAPDDVVMAQEWYEEPEDSDLKVVRGQRLRYIFRNRPSLEEYVNALQAMMRVDHKKLDTPLYTLEPALTWNETRLNVR